MKKSHLRWYLSIQDKINSEQVCKKYKTAAKYFTRRSPLNFRNTAIMLLNLIKKSTKVEVMNFFDEYDELALSPSRQAFCQAREKISYLMFKDFWAESCRLALENDEALTYQGYRLFAIDGTSFPVGKRSRLGDAFGTTSTIPGKSMCRIGGVVDVLNNTLVAAEAAPFSIGERSLALKQIRAMRHIPAALYLFDRGYWSAELVEQITGNKQKFLMRLASNAIKGVEEADAEVTVRGQRLRTYSFRLPSGNREILLTNLSKREATGEELAALYRKRWGIETKYLELKSRLQLDSLSGQSVNTILQDIYTTLCMSNVVAFICWDADREIEEKAENAGHQYVHMANRNICIAALRKRFVKLCLMDDRTQADKMFQHIQDEIVRCITPKAKSKSRARADRKSPSAERNPYRSPL